MKGQTDQTRVDRKKGYVGEKKGGGVADVGSLSKGLTNKDDKKIKLRRMEGVTQAKE